MTKSGFSGILAELMSQDKLIKIVSKGDAKGVGKGDVYYTRFNNKNKKDPSKKLSLKKYNKKTRTHQDYTQKK
ncbi:50S ribosomal protein L33 [Candidatus Kaiserbacteria bacterium RIFOXYB1_FULL_46_14]|uniref:Large ribosomal subunit protein bL33 n=1 Tax=Candidatus Kaiserbacteria bacterium RIFOXYB1_FULL_46_14 TaxID=1798531 RepID=A0A1F6FJL6_9BACT|nr:MAG: 50S ribosomal protein L33 [Candidatus Kaiserbacteria bacterium RIFOXYB1_FULL_46_14]